jgi:hypothetical protein
LYDMERPNSWFALLECDPPDFLTFFLIDVICPPFSVKVRR